MTLAQTNSQPITTSIANILHHCEQVSLWSLTFTHASDTQKAHVSPTTFDQDLDKATKSGILPERCGRSNSGTSHTKKNNYKKHCVSKNTSGGSDPVSSETCFSFVLWWAKIYTCKWLLCMALSNQGWYFGHCFLQCCTGTFASKHKKEFSNDRTSWLPARSVGMMEVFRNKIEKLTRLLFVTILECIS